MFRFSLAASRQHATIGGIKLEVFHSDTFVAVEKSPIFGGELLSRKNFISRFSSPAFVVHGWEQKRFSYNFFLVSVLRLIFFCHDFNCQTFIHQPRRWHLFLFRFVLFMMWCTYGIISFRFTPLFFPLDNMIVSLFFSVFSCNARHSYRAEPASFVTLTVVINNSI